MIYPQRIRRKLDAMRAAIFAAVAVSSTWFVLNFAVFSFVGLAAAVSLSAAPLALVLIPLIALGLFVGTTDNIKVYEELHHLTPTKEEAEYRKLIELFDLQSVWVQRRILHLLNKCKRADAYPLLQYCLRQDVLASIIDNSYTERSLFAQFHQAMKREAIIQFLSVGTQISRPVIADIKCEVAQKAVSQKSALTMQQEPGLRVLVPSQSSNDVAIQIDQGQSVSSPVSDEKETALQNSSIAFFARNHNASANRGDIELQDQSMHRAANRNHR